MIIYLYLSKTSSVFVDLSNHHSAPFYLPSKPTFQGFNRKTFLLGSVVDVVVEVGVIVGASLPKGQTYSYGQTQTFRFGSNTN